MVRMVKSDQNPTPRMDMAIWGKRVNRYTKAPHLQGYYTVHSGDEREI